MKVTTMMLRILNILLSLVEEVMVVGVHLGHLLVEEAEVVDEEDL
jgi:hypothetical protein